MSKSRASVFRSIRGPGHQLSRHAQRLEERQRFLTAKRVVGEAAPKPTLAQRVLPWRRKKRARDLEFRAKQREQMRQHEHDSRVWETARRDYRHAFGGIHPRGRSDRRALHAVKVLHKLALRNLAHEPGQFDHEQRRRVERLLRQGRTDDAHALAAETHLDLGPRA